MNTKSRFLPDVKIYYIIQEVIVECEAPLCYGIFSHHNQKTTAKKGLACSYYTTSLQNSKTNLPTPEKQKNAEPGLSTHSLRSSFHLRRPRPLTCFDASTAFSGLPVFRKSAIIHSWHRPRSHGRGFGSACGR